MFRGGRKCGQRVLKWAWSIQKVLPSLEEVAADQFEGVQSYSEECGRHPAPAHFRALQHRDSTVNSVDAQGPTGGA